MSELKHHGVKGMHWGVRRYQNYDGTRIGAQRRPRGSEEKSVVRKMVSKGTNSESLGKKVSDYYKEKKDNKVRQDREANENLKKAGFEGKISKSVVMKEIQKNIKNKINKNLDPVSNYNDSVKDVGEYVKSNKKDIQSVVDKYNKNEPLKKSKEYKNFAQAEKELNNAFSADERKSTLQTQKRVLDAFDKYEDAEKAWNNYQNNRDNRIIREVSNQYLKKRGYSINDSSRYTLEQIFALSMRNYGVKRS